VGKVNDLCKDTVTYSEPLLMQTCILALTWVSSLDTATKFVITFTLGGLWAINALFLSCKLVLNYREKKGGELGGSI
jgi:hypothetical protein